MKLIRWIKEQGGAYAPIVLRFGIAFVFLHFGILQLIMPANFIGFMPDFLQPYRFQEMGRGMMGSGMMAQMRVSEPTTIPFALVRFNGLFEVIFGMFLLLGLFTRVSAFLLGAHLLLLTLEFLVEFGFTNDVFARDVGLSAATLAIVLLGPDKWCLDLRKKT